MIIRSCLLSAVEIAYRHSTALLWTVCAVVDQTLEICMQVTFSLHSLAFLHALLQRIVHLEQSMTPQQRCVTCVLTTSTGLNTRTLSCVSSVLRTHTPCALGRCHKKCVWMQTPYKQSHCLPLTLLQVIYNICISLSGYC